MLMHVHQARGEPLPEARLVESEDPYDQLVFATARALMQAEDGDLEGAASYAAEVTQAMVAGAGMHEDLEMLWGPVVELQLAAGVVMPPRSCWSSRDRPWAVGRPHFVGAWSPDCGACSRSPVEMIRRQTSASAERARRSTPRRTCCAHPP